MSNECRKIRAEGTYEGKQGFSYFQGSARETVGAEALCMHIRRVPPGGRARAHRHETHETAIYVISGHVVSWWGDRLQHRMETGPGDLIYIPAGVPHLPVNVGTEECVAVVARTDPHEQESVVLMPELEELVPA